MHGMVPFAFAQGDTVACPQLRERTSATSHAAVSASAGSRCLLHHLRPEPPEVLVRPRLQLPGDRAEEQPGLRHAAASRACSSASGRLGGTTATRSSRFERSRGAPGSAPRSAAAPLQPPRETQSGFPGVALPGERARRRSALEPHAAAGAEDREPRGERVAQRAGGAELAETAAGEYGTLSPGSRSGAPCSISSLRRRGLDRCSRRSPTGGWRSHRRPPRSPTWPNQRPPSRPPA